LQVLDDGIITDGQGRTINFKNSIIVLTSNLGSQSINDLSVRKEDTNEIKKVVDNEIKKFFKPEFLNRLDEIVIFNNFELNDIKEIAKIQLKHLEKRLNKKNLKFKITDEAINQLVQNSFDHAYGARPLKRIIQKQIETKISNNIESKFKEIANELAPDPLNMDRLILNRLFHQTPDSPDKKNIN